MARIPVATAILLICVACAQADVFPGRKILATCTKKQAACSLYNDTCCDKQTEKLMCSMSQSCTTTALGTQSCSSVCVYQTSTNKDMKRVKIGKFYGWETGKRTAPAVLVIQEWWGVNDAIKSVAQHLALQGYRTLIPDIYQGKVALTAAEARHYAGDLNWPTAIRQFREAVNYLKKTGSPKVGVTGFCQGGGLSFCAAQHADVVVAVPFYGMPNQTFCQPDKIKVPVHIHVGRNDTSIPVARAEGVYNQIKDAGLVEDVELYLYDNTPHAFMNGLTEEGRAQLGGPTRLPPLDSVTTGFARLTAVLARYLKDQK